MRSFQSECDKKPKDQKDAPPAKAQEPSAGVTDTNKKMSKEKPKKDEKVKKDKKAAKIDLDCTQNDSKMKTVDNNMTQNEITAVDDKHQEEGDKKPPAEPKSTKTADNDKHPSVKVSVCLVVFKRKRIFLESSIINKRATIAFSGFF